MINETVNIKVIGTANGRNWEEYWGELRKPGEWVDYIFIQVLSLTVRNYLILVLLSNNVKIWRKKTR